MEYWAVSDLNPADLKEFVLRFQAADEFPA